jgi:signal peptidase I
LNNGDIVIAERISVNRMNLHREDIVCVYSPLEYPKLLCKRLAYKEYDQILNEDATRIRVPPGHCYVLGDNLYQSIDSRQFGVIPVGLVQLRVVFRIWPLHKAGWLSSHWFWERDEEI